MQILAVFRKAYEGFLVDLLYPLVSSADRIEEYDVKDMLEAIKVSQLPSMFVMFVT